MKYLNCLKNLVIRFLSMFLAGPQPCECKKCSCAKKPAKKTTTKKTVTKKATKKSSK